MAEQKPSVGRTVHYVAYGTPGGEFPSGVCRCAFITEVSDGGVGDVVEAVGVMVANPSGLFFNRNIPHDETGKAPGSWHWPERV